MKWLYRVLDFLFGVPTPRRCRRCDAVVRVTESGSINSFAWKTEWECPDCALTGFEIST